MFSVQPRHDPERTTRAAELIEEEVYDDADSEIDAEVILVLYLAFPNQPEHEFASIELKRSPQSVADSHGRGFGSCSGGLTAGGRRYGMNRSYRVTKKTTTGVVVKASESCTTSSGKRFHGEAELAIEIGFPSAKVLDNGSVFRWEFRQPRK